jgi:hypothetical protein
MCLKLLKEYKEHIIQPFLNQIYNFNNFEINLKMLFSKYIFHLQSTFKKLII